MYISQQNGPALWNNAISEEQLPRIQGYLQVCSARRLYTSAVNNHVHCGVNSHLLDSRSWMEAKLSLAQGKGEVGAITCHNAIWKEWAGTGLFCVDLPWRGTVSTSACTSLPCFRVKVWDKTACSCRSGPRPQQRPGSSHRQGGARQSRVSQDSSNKETGEPPRS